jgi:hypothetical protein
LVYYDLAKLERLVFTNILSIYRNTLAIIAKAVTAPINQRLILIIAVQGAKAGGFADSVITQIAGTVMFPTEKEGLKQK